MSDNDPALVRSVNIDMNPSSPAIAEDDDHFRQSVQPDINTLEAKKIGRYFRMNLSVLLVMNLLFYVFEEIVGAPLVTSAHDMILLLLGWVAQEMYRPRGLTLYRKLTIVTMVVDFFSLLTTIVYVSYYADGFQGLLLLLIGFYVVEAVFKLASLRHCKNLEHIIADVAKTPGIYMA